jgi:(p)ppGpp synthase/HD superfamily hydrolase
VTADGLEASFGERVRALVVACTDTEPGYKSGVKREWLPRKEDYLAHIRGAQWVNRVALADKLDNARAILADYRAVGEPLWDRFTTKSRDDQLWFYRSSVEAFRAAGAEGFLIDELERTVAEIERLAATA